MRNGVGLLEPCQTAIVLRFCLWGRYYFHQPVAPVNSMVYDMNLGHALFDSWRREYHRSIAVSRYHRSGHPPPHLTAVLVRGGSAAIRYSTQGFYERPGRRSELRGTSQSLQAHFRGSSYQNVIVHTPAEKSVLCAACRVQGYVALWCNSIP